MESHTLRGCVDWNWLTIPTILSVRSHPAWVCGLKLSKFWTAYTWKCHTLRGCVDWNEMNVECSNKLLKSHPAWVCGLKHTGLNTHRRRNSHTLRGCVDWNRLLSPKCSILCLVTPCVGVWIETETISYRLMIIYVTPCVGVWIETR